MSATTLPLSVHHGLHGHSFLGNTEAAVFAQRVNNVGDKCSMGRTFKHILTGIKYVLPN